MFLFDSIQYVVYFSINCIQIRTDMVTRNNSKERRMKIESIRLSTSVIQPEQANGENSKAVTHKILLFEDK